MVLAHTHPPSTRGPMTRAEYDSLVQRGALEDARVELLYGRLVSMSPQGEPHTYAVGQLMVLLVRALGDRARVRIQAPFVAPDESEPEPDVAIVAPGNYLGGHPRGAFLIVEVAETSLARDRVKARLYAASGVTEYWIVNLSERAIEVHRHPSVEGYSAVTRHGPGEKLSLLAFEDIVVGIDEILPPPPRL